MDAPFFERVYDGLRIGVIRPKYVTAAPLEFPADLGVVVNLAVEQQPDRPILVRHRLHRVAAETAHDGEPPEAEPDRAVGGNPRFASVWAAVVQRLAGACGQSKLVGCSEVAVAKSQAFLQCHTPEADGHSTIREVFPRRGFCSG